MANNYNILANYIVSKYSKRISGSDIEEYLIGENPSERVMVGMLAENRVENSLNGTYKENSETRFESIPSISLTFVVKKGSEGSIHIIPEGLLFYTVKPDYEKIIEHILRIHSEKDRKDYSSINELCSEYADQKLQLPQTYKTVDISVAMKDGIEIDDSCNIRTAIL